MSLPANSSGSSAESSLIAGSVLPIQRAEELLATLPGVISARIVAGTNGAVEEIHLLTTMEVTPKQTVRNVESALIAHLGMRVSHKKISVATSDDGVRPARVAHPPFPSPAAPVGAPVVAPQPAAAASVTPVAPIVPISALAPTPHVAREQREQSPQVETRDKEHAHVAAPSEDHLPVGHRRLYFEDVEIRRSRARGITCRVTLRKGDAVFVGELEGPGDERLRVDLAARATLVAIKEAASDPGALALEGVRVIDAFDRKFVFVGVMTREGREHTLVTGSAEVRESAETAGVFAVLDATNRWLER
ncbi:MAG TPA: hypothetical protein VK636_15040 [Gemmatimonadaceae bacterium]|nr:hypothetical protein [Gemmatimonadaceae bacterium]